MKFLCVCEGGNVRSACLAYLLKTFHNQEAIALGYKHSTEETLYVLSDWADHIVLMQPHFVGMIPEDFDDKISIVDVGPDTYGTPFHAGLQLGLKQIVDDWSRTDFDLQHRQTV